MRKSPLYVAAAIFAVVALAHWLRFFLESAVVVDGFSVPVFWSLPAAIVLVLLAAWMIVAGRRS